MTNTTVSKADQDRIASNIDRLRKEVGARGSKLLVVTKLRSDEEVQAAYDTGQRMFGENRVQDLVAKHSRFPSDVEWHLIGHLQTNKVKYVVPFVSLIHSVDSLRLLEEINLQGSRINRVVPCLLQIGIAQEDSKFGMTEAEAEAILNTMDSYRFVAVRGLMGMATLTQDREQIRREFERIKSFYDTLRARTYGGSVVFEELSMGMTTDYEIALDVGTTLVRIGTAVFA